MADILKRALRLGAVVALCALVLYFMDIGCVIRWFTGVSCPGCGLTRAWLCALTFDFDAAFAYHPLFWLVPPTVMAAIAYERASQRASSSYAACSRMRRVLAVCLLLLAAALVALWLVRLIDPQDAGLLFGGVPPQGVSADIVSVRWLR